MAYSNILPRTKNITGADCSGSDATANRTYTISDVGILSSGMDIVINGTSLHEGATYDYTLSSSVITFLNIIDDTDIISIRYWITVPKTTESSLVTSTSLRYSTPLMLAEVIGARKNVPEWTIGETPVNETVGTGDNSNDTFYTDQRNIIADTYYLYAGGVLMTETTHYAMDVDDGEITLTADGITMLGIDDLTAKYSYVGYDISNSQLVATLLRAEQEVDNSVNSTFTDGTTTNPDYPIKVEIQKSRGSFINEFSTENKPLIDVTSTLDGDMDISQVTIDLVDGTKFTSSGYLLIDSEVVSYTGVSSNQLTGVSRGALGTTAATHDDGETVHTAILFVSDTTEGSAPSFTVQPWETHMEVDEYGVFTRYKDASPDLLSANSVRNRVKMIYNYGYDTVPTDITRLTLIYAKRMLMQDNISSANIGGRNEFNPEMFNADENEMQRIINKYIVLPMGNV